MQKTFSALLKPTNQRRRKSVISLTPLIDVVFILLIFFMLASSFQDWRSLLLDTSNARGALMAAEQAAFIIQLTESEIKLNGEAITLDALVEKAQIRQPADQVVSLQPMQATLVQQLIQVLDALNAAGVQPLQLLDDSEWQAELLKSDQEEY